MPELKCIYDPLVELMNYYANSKAQARRDERDALSLEDKLKRRIVEGDKIGLNEDLKNALQKYSPLQIINEILLEGMKVVGDLFGSGQMQLPFVLQSAEAMKSAVKFLESYMDRLEGMQKGVMVLATVKGDVHDIGKNLVDIILTNNGYKVVNLGIKVPVEQIIEAAEINLADAIGMSGLLVKSTVVMKENLELMEHRGIKTPVVLGGAALTRRYVEHDLRQVYNGHLSYANDAFDGLRFMENVKSGKLGVAERKDPPTKLSSVDESVGMNAISVSVSSTSDRKAFDVPMRSKVSREVPVPEPPFFGSIVVTDLKIEKVWEYLNEVALIRGQWQFSKKGVAEEDYRRFLESEVYPVLEGLKLKVKREKLFTPKIVYGYFPCQSDGNELIVYRPKDEKELYGKWESIQKSAETGDRKPGPQRSKPTSGLQFSSSGMMEWVRFEFPRQPNDRFLCISDYFKSVDSGYYDVISMQAVTIGSKASDYTKKLFEDGSYQDYLYLHGLSVESAEALAEYWHRIVRTELGIHAKDAAEMKRLFAQGYQGSRFSFGYPACPNLEDQAKLFEILSPQRIGVSLTDEFQLVPEQSTTAIVVHHPEARYFTISTGAASLAKGDEPRASTAGSE